MKCVSSLSRPLLGFVPLAALGTSFLLTLSGCPQGADLEHPEEYGLTGGSSAGPGTGGTAPGSGGTTGGTTGGSGGTGSGVTLTVDCGSDTYQNVLTQNCATIGCHRMVGQAPAPSGLVLTPDSGLVGRIKDVKAQHGDILCPPDFNTCVPASCDPNALLVNSANPSASWILAKIKGAQSDCGDPMPSPNGPTDPVEACLENFVAAVAAVPK
jgi:hypothetical protein